MSWGPSTHQRVLFAGLFPLLLFALMLASYWVAERLAEQNEAFAQIGQSFSRELAAASRYGLFAGDTEALHELASEFVQRPHVRMVTIRGADTELTVRAYAQGIREDPATLIRFALSVEPQRARRLDLDHDWNLGANPVPEQHILGEVAVYLGTELARQETYLLIGNSLVLLVVGLGVGILLLWRISRAIADPLAQITELVEKAAAGDFSERAPESSSGELGKLERGLNQMLAALEDHRVEMQRRIDQATGELQQRNRELDRARRAALLASQAKSDFLAHMSHEIRTPLHGVAGFTQLLAQSTLGSEQRQQLDFLQEAIDDLILVVNQILDFSRIESRELELRQEPFALRELTQSVVHLLLPQASSKGIAFRCVVADTVPDWLLGDPLRIKQILTNLAANAVKYTLTGTVHLRVEAKTPTSSELCHLRMVVHDTGIGIATQDQQRIFEPFAQAAISDRQNFQGTGLGLAIVKRLLDSMDGQIEVTSNPGHGSRFTVFLTLPIASEPTADAAADRMNLFSGQQPLAGLRILVVDDKRVNRELLRAMLVRHGAQVTLASGGVEALSCFAQEEFSAVLVDIHMPGMGGVELSRRLCAQSRGGYPPILAISADVISRAEILRQIPQFAAFLLKPISEAKLVKIILTTQPLLPPAQPAPPAAATAASMPAPAHTPTPASMPAPAHTPTPAPTPPTTHASKPAPELDSAPTPITASASAESSAESAKTRSSDPDPLADDTAKLLLHSELPKPQQTHPIPLANDNPNPLVQCELPELQQAHAGPLTDSALTQLFRRELPAELAAIEAALEAKDWPRLADLLHGLKGAAAVCAQTELIAPLQEAQRAAMAQDLHLLLEQLARLHSAINDHGAVPPRRMTNPATDAHG